MAPSIDMQLARRIDGWGGWVLCTLLFGVSRLHARFGGPAQPAWRATTPPGDDLAGFEPRRVLAIKFYGLGNVAMLLPVLGALRKAFPDAEVDFLTMGDNRTLLERSGAANRVHSVDTSSFVALARSLAGVVRTARARRYDLVIDFEQFIKLSAVIAYASGAPRRIGFNTDGQRRGVLYTTRVVYTDSEHQSRIFARLLRPLRIDTTPVTPGIELKAEEEAAVAGKLAAACVPDPPSPLVCVHVGSGPNFYRVPVKRWPIESFARLCDGLVERHGATVVLTGKGEEERRLVDELQQRAQHPVVDLCDRLGLLELIALLRRSDLTVSNDTSVMHLSSLVETPVAAFFGPTSPLHYGPWNEQDQVFYQDYYCSPCITNYNLKVSRCARPVCIQRIGVDEVLDTLGRRYLDADAPLRSTRPPR